ncbi:phosphoglycerate mutase (2,3-diphosphoglycerate-independent) [Candidatus Woesebacteria bacterium RIFCSPHIGHO2_01_FULL_39_32]|uniref:2,3-bisphosphoglycerate-independent phosphoglycerate mutase n=1 Tax=Candidatus Woesebacteria bacterium RIFCSPLOWO2_01_FULL_39_25 TaxID=1802521 RepID=A0A1F8BK36_9BACT|nr:MAG: phosphoglycerate mutase (2,3-diphosphoglycerate-independent) [Candidatus Woesebacteria bacterium RIFCSPHIGHO2_01_FULL_39_32]OGM38903.1 MAG: phosphoglycerate mutase (2,3-diphosphoglycerate-independent) [Candidatus Woesebacteria bacterium RIFCSPHIGHO2_12_FULL_38_11]OGM64403.1 MAG: phosphoglycerate mutase (2,3-diphosphoglycerate-independent) [Candidatus Woesebacteria bacterium RIFCSPLOWO2_01_FULL_39_25]
MFNLPFLGKKKNTIKPTVLVVLDGFGIAPPSAGNAITLAKTPNWERLIKNYPHGELIASGESVGLPANEVGNTEVGHLTLGAGRVILQDLKRINVAIEKGSFFENKAFLSAAAHVKQNNSKLHIMGLASSGNVHSSLGHLYSLLQFCKKEEIREVYLHVFTDGRDAPPKEAVEIILELEHHLSLLKLGKIASISGRYYAMDRDRRWDRTARTYKALVEGAAIQTFSASDAIKGAYLRGQTDEFIEPTIIADKSGPLGLISDKDAVIFFNYRIDRPRQLTMAFTLPNFENLKAFDFGYNPETSREEGKVEFGTTFTRGKVVQNLFFVTMTQYHQNIPVSAVAFAPETVNLPLGKVLSDLGLKQLHMAESEKERFVTYYFNGLQENAFSGEEEAVVSSPKVDTYDKKPEMSLPKLVKEFRKRIRRDAFHFVVINFANPDMVAHTGNLQASILAIESVDRYLDELVREVLEVDGFIVITADHGNAEELLTFPTATYFYTSSAGTVNTDHSNNPVPILIVGKNMPTNFILGRGGLADVSPTILALMGIAKPDEMTGRNLLEGKSLVRLSETEIQRTDKPVTEN